MMKVLVITGGIGSGKSEVCRILRDAGVAAQYNADERVKALYTAHPDLLSRIEKALGCTLKDEHGVFVPKKLAAEIFSDSKKLEVVESLVFPALKEDFETFAAQHYNDEFVVFESATVLEKPQFEGFGDVTILVDAPYEVRLARASARDKAGRDAVEARMANQKLMNALSEGETDPRIDMVIMNDSDIDALIERTDKTMTVLFGDWKKINNIKEV